MEEKQVLTREEREELNLQAVRGLGSLSSKQLAYVLAEWAKRGGCDE